MNSSVHKVKLGSDFYACFLFILCCGSVSFLSGSGPDLKSNNFFQKYNTQNSSFFLLFISLLFYILHINQKSDLFLKIIWYSYNFCWFFICYPDPFHGFWIRQTESRSTALFLTNEKVINLLDCKFVILYLLLILMMRPRQSINQSRPRGLFLLTSFIASEITWN